MVDGVLDQTLSFPTPLRVPNGRTIDRPANIRKDSSDLGITVWVRRMGNQLIVRRLASAQPALSRRALALIVTTQVRRHRKHANFGC